VVLAHRVPERLDDIDLRGIEWADRDRGGGHGSAPHATHAGSGSDERGANGGIASA
jgi:hypothetical protein